MKDSTITLKEHGNIESSLNYFLKLKLPKHIKILDVGCNYGTLIYKLNKAGYNNSCGIDINRESIKSGKEKHPHINISPYDGRLVPFEDNSFDVILMFDVIEHIPDVQNFLKEQIYRVLKNDGQLIFQTPNKYINIPWEIIHQKSFSKYKQYHCSLQTKNSLQILLQNSNFKDIKIEKYNILTKHNKRKVGLLGLPLLYLLQKNPLPLFPNFWGNCKK